MGAKFYRGSDKPKKIKKRLTQTRTWFRTLKWVACKCTLYLTRRPRPPNFHRRTSFQGILGKQHRLFAAPRHEKVRYYDPHSLCAPKPTQDCRLYCSCVKHPFLQHFFQFLFRQCKLQLDQHRMWSHDGWHAEMLRKPQAGKPCRDLLILYRWLPSVGMRKVIKLLYLN